MERARELEIGFNWCVLPGKEKKDLNLLVIPANGNPVVLSPEVCGKVYDMITEYFAMEETLETEEVAPLLFEKEDKLQDKENPF